MHRVRTWGNQVALAVGNRRCEGVVQVHKRHRLLLLLLRLLLLRLPLSSGGSGGSSSSWRLQAQGRPHASLQGLVLRVVAAAVGLCTVRTSVGGGVRGGKGGGWAAAAVASSWSPIVSCQRVALYHSSWWGSPGAVRRAGRRILITHPFITLTPSPPHP